MPTSGETISRLARVSVGHTPVISHHLLVVGGVAASVACALGGQPMAWLLLAMATLAASRRAGLRSAIERLPMAGVIVVSAVFAIALVAGSLGFDIVSSPWSGRLVLSVVVIALVSLARVTARKSDASRTRSWTELGLAAVPAGLIGLIGAVLAASPLGARTSWFLSGDHVRHLALVTRTIDAGGLEYASQTYPRGWHATLAILWSMTGSERDPQGLAALIRLQSLATWTVLGLVSLALALTAASMHGARGGRPFAGGSAGAAAGALVLGPWFFGDYVPRGFETSLLALLVLAAAAHRCTEIRDGRDGRATLAFVATSGALMAHVWQVLLPAVGVLILLVLLRRWRGRPTTRALVGDAAALASAGALALPGLLAAARGYGLDAVARAGDVPPPVVGWLVLVVASAAVLLVTGARTALTAPVASSAAAMATAFALAAVVGVGLSSYYPSKTLWTAAALGLPLIGATAAHLFERSESDRRLRGPAIVALAAVGLAALISAVTPIAGVSGSWSAADGRTVIDTVTSRAAPTTTVVWGVGSDVDDATSQLLLDFYSATSTTEPLGLAPRDPEAQCALLEAAELPVVMSEAPEPEVRARFACAPSLRVVRMSGGP